ncbi:DedA family protein [Aerosakkonemataceae cyanobacterium BLCC-F50]|uniref:DedA family protein n=1 Tax=Floridaenema flaviceps BLCC-F50 TaxID=3153642 RepID=A0ABV4XY53_9CYAN
MLDWIVSSINYLGYWGIVFLMFLENLFPPIPSEVIMPLAGFTTTQGKLNITFVILAGTLGSLLGALFWYYIGITVGEKRLKRLADRYGKWLSISSEDIDKSKKWFYKYGGLAVLLGRIIPGIRTFISVPAGLNNMPIVPFLFYSTIGSALWVALLTFAGYFLGQNYQLIEKYLSPISSFVLIALIVAFVFWLVKRKRKRFKAKNH